MQKIVIALLVVAFVSARISAETMSEKLVLSMYDATDRHPVGSFNFTVSEEMPTVVVLRVDKPLNFTSKHPYVAILLYRGLDVKPGCRTTAPPIEFDGGEPVVLYSGLDKDIVNKADYMTGFEASLDFMVGHNRVCNVAVMFSVSADDPEPSPIACGKIRYAAWPDSFLKNWNNDVSVSKLMISPLLETAIDAHTTSKINAVTDLYSASSGALTGLMFHQSRIINYLRTTVIPFDREWGNAAAVAVVYLAKHVQPGCATFGPAVSRIREGTKDSYPLTLFIANITDIRTPPFATLTGYASVSKDSEFNLVDHVVVVYSLKSTDLRVLNDFLQPTNTHTRLACGSIRYADAAEDNFLKWAPVGPKPIRMPETVKLSLIVKSLTPGYKRVREKIVDEALGKCGFR